MEERVKLFKEEFRGSPVEWNKILLNKHHILVSPNTAKSFTRRHKKQIEEDSFREKVAKKYSQQELRNELDIDSRNEEFLSRLKLIVPKIDEFYPRNIAEPELDESKDAEDVVIQISDSHLGMKIDPEQSGGLAHYNKDIFIERLEKLKKITLRILGIVQGYANIENIWLVYLGDLTEGHDVFKGQSYSLDMNAAEASYLVAKKFAEFEILLYESVPANNIITIEIPGNHGVPGGKKAGDVPLTLNFDWLSYHIKDLIIKNFLGNLKAPVQKKIIHNISNSWFELFNIQGFKFLATHGAEIRRYMAIPFYSMIKLDAKYLRLLEQHFDYWLTAHQHTPCTIPAGGGEIIMNGSFPGSSMLSVRQLTEGQPAAQWMFSVHPRKGISARWKILLEEKKEPKQIRILSANS